MFWITATPGNRAGDELPAAGFPDTTTIFDRLEEAGHPLEVLRQGLRPDDHVRQPRALGDRAAQLLRFRSSRCARFVDARRSCFEHIVDMQEFYRDAGGPAAGRLVHRTGGLNEHPPGR